MDSVFEPALEDQLEGGFFGTDQISVQNSQIQGKEERDKPNN